MISVQEPAKSFTIITTVLLPTLLFTCSTVFPVFKEWVWKEEMKYWTAPPPWSGCKWWRWRVSSWWTSTPSGPDPARLCCLLLWKQKLRFRNLFSRHFFKIYSKIYCQVATGQDRIKYVTACSDMVPQLSMFKGICKPLFLFILEGKGCKLLAMTPSGH